MQKTISISSTGKLMWGGIFIIKKEYDSRKYLGYIYLLISLGLMLQTVIQGNIPVESIVKICIAGYTATLVVGFLVGLYACGLYYIRIFNYFYMFNREDVFWTQGSNISRNDRRTKK